MFAQNIQYSYDSETSLIFYKKICEVCLCLIYADKGPIYSSALTALPRRSTKARFLLVLVKEKLKFNM